MSYLAPAFLLLTYLVFATPANALQCKEIVPDDAFKVATRVVIARLKSIRPVADSETRFELSFDVVASLKGPPSNKIDVTLEKTPWVDPSHYATGEQYLWFLEPGQAEVRACEKILVLQGRADRWYASWQEENSD